MQLFKNLFIEPEHVYSIRVTLYKCVWVELMDSNIYCRNLQDRFLAFPEDQHPIVLQIGGSNLGNLAKATKLANAYSYDEINLK